MNSLFVFLFTSEAERNEPRQISVTRKSKSLEFVDDGISADVHVKVYRRRKETSQGRVVRRGVSYYVRGTSGPRTEKVDRAL